MIHCVIGIVAHSVIMDEWMPYDTFAVATAELEDQIVREAYEPAKKLAENPQIDIVRIVRYTQNSIIGQIQG